MSGMYDGPVAVADIRLGDGDLGQVMLRHQPSQDAIRVGEVGDRNVVGVGLVRYMATQGLANMRGGGNIRAFSGRQICHEK